MFHVVLFEPEIPPNTGNAIRLCANTGAQLHLVKPLGFDLDRRSLRRAGLDYAWMARVHVHASLEACLAALDSGCSVTAIETGVARRYDEVRWRPGDAMLFGSERRGLPEPVLQRVGGAPSTASVPMQAGNRSLNLANCVALVLYEAWRQNDFRDPALHAPLRTPT
jgi:tRNA (cytidine/uridine-2'-O-)-methyltransferase